MHAHVCVSVQWTILWSAMTLMRAMSHLQNPTATVISRLMEMRMLIPAVTGTKVGGHKRSVDMDEVTAVAYEEG